MNTRVLSGKLNFRWENIDVDDVDARPRRPHGDSPFHRGTGRVGGKNKVQIFFFLLLVYGKGWPFFIAHDRL